MNELRYTTIDKNTWADGPWQTEPDKIQWHDGRFACLVVRNPHSGAWCGYVGVPGNHSCHGVDCGAVDVLVHGGLTYSAFCQHGEPEDSGICHVVSDGEDDRVWWLGFDCAHAGDQMPGTQSLLPDYLFVGSTYRDLAYVQDEVRQLSKQLAQL